MMNAEAEAAIASSQTAVADETNANAATAAAPDAVANDGNERGVHPPASASEAEDFVMFGARLPSDLFDDVAFAIDALLAEEVAGLPLLPRTAPKTTASSSSEPRGRRHEKKAGKEGGDRTEDEQPRTGEEKLMRTLRGTYRRNLDLAEAYCARNVFTVRYHSKTTRRKILERYLAQDDDDRDDVGGTKGDESKGKGESAPPPARTTFGAPDGELPSPEQLADMDREILRSRQRLQEAKRRRMQLKRQLERLAKASETLAGVREALAELRAGGGSAASWMGKLRESVRNAVEGHEELRGWNARAEEVLRMLDKIKVEREEADNSSGKSDGEERVVGREQDERARKRMRDIGGGTDGSHGTEVYIPSLLKKLRGK